MTGADYVRAIEQHVCQKNDGHLIRIVGPAFEVVRGWEQGGVPLKVALRGIDRYFERYYRSGPRRRPARVEFCDADVLETFDEWRRAVGIAARAGARETSPEDAAVDVGGRGPSLPAHLERVLLKLSNARAKGRLGADADALIDRVSDEMDRARAHSRGLRGDARRDLVQRLADIDRALLDAASAALAGDEHAALGAEADEELEAYRERMPPDRYARVRAAIVDRLIRDRFGLPIVSFT